MKTMKLLGYCLSVSLFIINGCTTGTKNEIKAFADQAVKVKVQKLETNSGSTGQSYIGTVQESVSVPLSFLTAGLVEKVLVDEGQSVSKGQLLAVLNSESYQNAYQIALSKAKQAQDAFDRLDPVYKKGSLPEVKYVEIQTGLEQAKSMASMSEKNLKDCKLYAPTSGIIGKRMIEPGMSIIPGNPVLQLVKIEKVKVSIPIPENEITGIAKGQKVQVRVLAIGDQSFEGEVKEMGVLSNPLSHTYTVKVELNNPGGTLKPGMVCEAAISNPTMANRIVVPLSAVQQNSNGEKYVFVANSGKAGKRAVETGSLVCNGVVIENGLSSGDLLITEGYQKINQNTTIEIIK